MSDVAGAGAGSRGMGAPADQRTHALRAADGENVGRRIVRRARRAVVGTQAPTQREHATNDSGGGGGGGGGEAVALVVRAATDGNASDSVDDDNDDDHDDDDNDDNDDNGGGGASPVTPTASAVDKEFAKLHPLEVRACGSAATSAAILSRCRRSLPSQPTPPLRRRRRRRRRRSFSARRRPT